MSEQRDRERAERSAQQRARMAEATRKRRLASRRAKPSLPELPTEPAEVPRPGADPKFSLFFFSDDGASHEHDKYGLLLAAARFGDEHGLHSIWIPERHFHPFGGLYASPALLAAAVASTTRRIEIRAGSVVLPLNHPVRVVEQWSMLDNLSGGRVGVAFASGWVPEDFVLGTTPFSERRRDMLERLDLVLRLWKGEAVEFTPPGVDEPCTLRVYPSPLRPELPIWITTAGTRQTWLEAGRRGLNVLTGLLQSNLAQVADNIAAYRDARREAGHDPHTGCVTLMMHTFLGPDAATVRARVRGPLLAYLETHLDIYASQSKLAASLPVDPSEFSEDDKAALAELAFERYYRDSGLFGTPESCVATVQRIRAAGVDEIGCLVDFGVERAAVLEGLECLVELRDRATAAATAPGPSGGG